MVTTKFSAAWTQQSNLLWRRNHSNNKQQSRVTCFLLLFLSMNFRKCTTLLFLCCTLCFVTRKHTYSLSIHLFFGWSIQELLFHFEILTPRDAACPRFSMCVSADRPVCVLACRCSSSLRVKRFPQKTQLQTKGLSPVCSRT